MKILGVDCGLDGGLVMLDEERVVGRLVMPTLPAPNGKGRELDVPFILQSLDSWKPERVFIERAFVMPKQSSTGGFTIGKNYGILLGILSARACSFQVVRPQDWQKLIFQGLGKGNTKAASVLVGQRLWPTVDWRATGRCKGPHDGLTDAACIAEFGRRTWSKVISD